MVRSEDKGCPIIAKETVDKARYAFDAFVDFDYILNITFGIRPKTVPNRIQSFKEMNTNTRRWKVRDTKEVKEEDDFVRVKLCFESGVFFSAFEELFDPFEHPAIQAPAIFKETHEGLLTINRGHTRIGNGYLLQNLQIPQNKSGQRRDLRGRVRTLAEYRDFPTPKSNVIH